MSKLLLNVISLSKRFSNVLALDNITFKLQEGEILGLAGRRGAGKTSLLNIIGCASSFSEGEVIFQDKPLGNMTLMQARLAGIELVHQMPRMVEQLDILQNIFLGREICKPREVGMPDIDQMYWRAKELLARFDLPVSVLRMPTSSLNDEQRQVVAISRALCCTPRLLLLDDPLASLSYPRQQMLLDYIEWLANQGAGIIISSENLKHLFSVTNRVMVLYEGRLAADRKTADCTPRDIVELIVGSSSREQVTPVVWALESFHAAQRQTEELYRAQTALHQSLEASDSLNRQLVQRLSEQVKTMDTLNLALQETQRRLMTESEEERKALARELHDQVIQDLLSFNYRLEEAEDNLLPDNRHAELDSIREGIRQVVSDLRQLCQDLRPPTIDYHGLTSAIRSLAQEWAERNNVDLQLEIDPDLGRLPEAIELSVFRIVQEGLNNIRKHAAAKHVHLTMRRTPMDSLLVCLTDDGAGIKTPPDLVSLSGGKHFGLLGISERAALLGGSLKVITPNEGGLELQIEIPSPYPSV